MGGVSSRSGVCGELVVSMEEEGCGEEERESEGEDESMIGLFGVPVSSVIGEGYPVECELEVVVYDCQQG